MDQLAKLEIMVEQAGLPELLQKGSFEIVTRRANGKMLPFVNASLPNDPVKAQQAMQQLLGNTGSCGLEEVRGAMRAASASFKSLTSTCKNMSVQVDQIYKMVNSVQSLSYLNVGLGLANIAVNVAGFAMVSAKLNALSAEVQRLSSRLNQIVCLMKHEIIGKFQKLTMLYNQMSAKLESNESIDLDDLEKLIIEMRAFISEMVMNLNEQALQEEVLLEIVYTLIPAYTSLLCEFVKTYYFIKQTNSPNYPMFLNLFDELENSRFRQHLFDYYMLDKKLHNLDVIDILNAQSLLGINGRVQVEDELSLVRILETEKKYTTFEGTVNQYAKEQVKAAVAAA